VDLLIEHAAQAGRVEPEPRRLWPHVRSQVKRGVGMKIGMAVEAGDTHTPAAGA